MAEIPRGWELGFHLDKLPMAREVIYLIPTISGPQLCSWGSSSGTSARLNLVSGQGEQGEIISSVRPLKHAAIPGPLGSCRALITADTAAVLVSLCHKTQEESRAEAQGITNSKLNIFFFLILNRLNDNISPSSFLQRELPEIQTQQNFYPEFITVTGKGKVTPLCDSPEEPEPLPALKQGMVHLLH